MIAPASFPRASPATTEDRPGDKIASTSAVQVSPAKDRDYLSFSQLSLFQKCSLRYFFRYVEQLPEESVSASLLFGRGIHSAVEFHFCELLAGNEPPDLDTLLAEFNDGWEEQPADQITYARGDSRDRLAALADRVLTAFRGSDVAIPRGHILGVEEELRGRVIDGAPDLLARLDLLQQYNGTLTITDFKTSKNTWTDDDAGAAAGQLLLYADLARQRFPGLPIRLEFVVFKKAKRVAITRHEVALDAARVARTKRIAQRVWRAIAAGNFFPSPSPLNCGTCPFQKPCRRWSG